MLDTFLPRTKFRGPLMILAGALVLTVILVSFQFNFLEAKFYDFRMAHGIQPEFDSHIVLISLDDRTTKALNEFSPLPLDIHTRFMEAMERLSPQAVGYLVDMNRVNQLNPDLFRGEWGTRFVTSVKRLEAKGTQVLLGTPFDVTGEMLPPYPLSSLAHSIAVIHKDGNVFAEDKITRRALTYLYDKPVFHIELAQRLGLIPTGRPPHGSFYVPEVDGMYFLFRYHGNTATRGQKMGYPQISFLDVLNGNLAPDALKGKIALIGTESKADSGDFTMTPYSSLPFMNPKLVVHANILDSVIHDDGIVSTPAWVNWVITFASATFVLWWVFQSTPLYGVFATFSLSLVFLAVTHLAFQFKGVWIRESQPLVAIFLSYYLVVPYRLILEYKKRWEYQHKHEILIQVEELKTNFLSLVTHDLKTPVARIQGLAEVVLNKSAKRLDPKDREMLHSIIGATDDLNRFITSILELTKVESNRLHLRIESKDINQIIERSVEEFSAQARLREIQLETKLEPLFPVKIDSSLISKVINNLIDNALKYSLPGSSVTVETQEIGDRIEISVRDQGIGLTAEEKENLFTRFYRAKNDTTAQISGTGLGLYLTRYFVEAHGGQVKVESEKGQGSTFKILLPTGTGVSLTRAGIKTEEKEAYV